MLITKKLRGCKETVALLSLSISSKPAPELLPTTSTTSYYYYYYYYYFKPLVARRANEKINFRFEEGSRVISNQTVN